MLQYTIVDANIMKKKKLTGKSRFHLITFAANCQIWNFYGHSVANIIKNMYFCIQSVLDLTLFNIKCMFEKIVKLSSFTTKIR